MVGLIVLGGAAWLLFTPRGTPGGAGPARQPAALGTTPSPVASPTRDPRQPFCDPAKPSFVHGFGALKLQVGAKMGDALECEQVTLATGDTRQRTTTGYAYYRAGVNIPTFTNGFDHWALTDRGLVYWGGDVVDPPGAAPTVTPEPNPTPRP